MSNPTILTGDDDPQVSAGLVLRLAPERVVPPPLDAPPDMARLIPIAAKNGMDILGPPGPPPGR
jgi:hypothetical protein